MMRTHLVALALGAFAAGCAREQVPEPQSLGVGEILSAPADPRFERALEPRELHFPADHGPHESFQTEWWYFTGNLDAEDGRELAYQLTFFRRSLAFERPELDSGWAARDAALAHFTVGDAASGEFVSFERFQRHALGLSGAQGDPWRVWLRDWSASGELEGGGARLVAEGLASDGNGVAIDLVLRASGPVVLHGDRGLSRKGHEPGNASYYASIPRLETRGTVRIGGRERSVRGESWFDHEWSTSALDAGQTGWDWFALRFADGRVLMLYVLRRDDGSRDTTSSGTFVAADGTTHHLALDSFEIEALATWTSRRSGASYPSRWRIRVPAHALQVEITPTVPASELAHSVRYWEGPVRGEDGAGEAVRGFVELTGY
jgi:predicted secreted hydrolase